MSLDDVCPVHGYDCMPIVKIWAGKMYCGRCGLPLIRHETDSLDLLLLAIIDDEKGEGNENRN